MRYALYNNNRIFGLLRKRASRNSDALSGLGFLSIKLKPNNQWFESHRSELCAVKNVTHTHTKVNHTALYARGENVNAVECITKWREAHANTHSKEWSEEKKSSKTTKRSPNIMSIVCSICIDRNNLHFTDFFSLPFLYFVRFIRYVFSHWMFLYGMACVRGAFSFSGPQICAL